MELTISLNAEEEAKLVAQARSEGKTPEEVARAAIDLALGASEGVAKSDRSLLGMWASFGPGPSAEEIETSRADMISTLGRDDVA